MNHRSSSRCRESHTDRQTDGQREEGSVGKPEQRGCSNGLWVPQSCTGVFSWSTSCGGEVQHVVRWRAARWAHQVLQMLFVWMKRHNAESRTGRGGYPCGWGEEEPRGRWGRRGGGGGSHSSFDPGQFSAEQTCQHRNLCRSWWTVVWCGVEVERRRRRWRERWWRRDFKTLFCRFKGAPCSFRDGILIFACIYLMQTQKTFVVRLTLHCARLVRWQGPPHMNKVKQYVCWPFKVSLFAEFIQSSLFL